MLPSYAKLLHKIVETDEPVSVREFPTLGVKGLFPDPLFAYFKLAQAGFLTTYDVNDSTNMPVIPIYTNRSDLWRMCLLQLEGEHAFELLPCGVQYLFHAERFRDDDPLYANEVNYFHDLYTRRAVKTAASTLLADFRAALASGRGVDFAASLLPPRLPAPQSSSFPFDLYGAACSLMTRMATGREADSPAEEVIAYEIVDHAATLLAGWRDAGDITEHEWSDADKYLQDAPCLPSRSIKGFRVYIWDQDDHQHYPGTPTLRELIQSDPDRALFYSYGAEPRTALLLQPDN